MAKLTLKCTDFRPINRKTLLGFATINIAEMRMTISDVAIHERDGKRWAQLPSKPMIKGTEVLKDDNGKVRYSPIFNFESKEVEKAFSTAAVKAVSDAKFAEDFA